MMTHALVRVKPGRYCDPVSQGDWPARITEVVAGEVRRYRKERKISAQQLADRCAELGMEIPRAVLANLENGRRPIVSVAELIILARALEVPPVLLIAPVGRAETLEILPGREATPYGAAEWISGSAEMVDDEDGSGEPSLLSRRLPPEANAIQLYREYIEQVARQYRGLALLRESVKVANTDDQRRDVARADAERTAELMHQGNAYLRALRHQIAERGLIQPPELDALVRMDGDSEVIEAVLLRVADQNEGADRQV